MPDTTPNLSREFKKALDAHGYGFHFAAAVGYRNIDDIEFAFGTAADADAALGPLQETLGYYELALSPAKTLIEGFPRPARNLGYHNFEAFASERHGSSRNLT
jgi:hypothetical protein